MTELDNNEPLPYYKWLWRDWRANLDVQKLDYIAKGLYRSLLDEQWCEGKIPADRTRQALVCACPTEVMEQHWPSLSPFFEEDEEGNLVNSKLEKQRTSSDKKRAALARNGKKGGRGRKAIAFDLKANPIPEESNCHIAEQSRADTEQSISNQNTEKAIAFDGQGGEMNLKTFKAEITGAGARCGVAVKGYDNTWEALKILAIAHGYSTVVRDFEEFLNDEPGKEYPKGALLAYTWVAGDRLTSDSPAQASARDPEVVSLVRELSYLSGGQMAFADKHRIRLAEVLKEFSSGEIVAVFKTWLETNDLSDAYTQKGAANSFSQTADQLCYSARKHKQEAEQAQIAREAAVARLQSQAEAERLEREKKEQADSELFDPLA